MPITVDRKEKCSGCGICSSVCPKKCISMKMDDEGFRYPEIDFSDCINCGKCQTICPVLNRPVQSPATEVKDPAEPEIYASRTADKEVLEACSSGGIAFVIARYYLRMGYIVCGVRMTDDFSHAEHICISSENELHYLQGSKYIQSDAVAAYDYIGEILSNGGKVLFFGTPCQIAAVYNRFQKYLSNLVLIDLVCHGVPSQILWDKCREYVTQKYNASIEKVNFRSKEHGWEQFGIKINMDNGKEYYSPKNKGFIGLFTKNIFLRPACSECAFKGFDRCSDLTLGDFWGIEMVAPHYDKGRGVSLIMVNSQRGGELIRLIEDEIELEKVECGNLFQYRNKSMIRSVHVPKGREQYMKDLKCLSYEKLEKKYLSIGFMKRIKRKLKRVLK